RCVPRASRKHAVHAALYFEDLHGPQQNFNRRNLCPCFDGQRDCLRWIEAARVKGRHIPLRAAVFFCLCHAFFSDEVFTWPVLGADEVSARPKSKETILAQIICRDRRFRVQSSFPARVNLPQSAHLGPGKRLAFFIDDATRDDSPRYQPKKQVPHTLAHAQLQDCSRIVGRPLPVLLGDKARASDLQTVAAGIYALQFKPASRVRYGGSAPAVVVHVQQLHACAFEGFAPRQLHNHARDAAFVLLLCASKSVARRRLAQRERRRQESKKSVEYWLHFRLHSGDFTTGNVSKRYGTPRSSLGLTRASAYFTASSPLRHPP